MPGNNINPTTIWTPQNGFDSGWAAGGPTTAFGTNNTSGVPQNVSNSNPWQITNPDYNAQTNPGVPQTINDPTATATPTGGSWTGANGLVTTGVMNPYGQTKNNAAFGYMGADPSQNVNPWAIPPTQSNTPAPTQPQTGGPDPNQNSGPGSQTPAVGTQFTASDGSMMTWNGSGWDTATPTPPSSGTDSSYNPAQSSNPTPIRKGFGGQNPTGAMTDPNAVQYNSLGDPITNSGFGNGTFQNGPTNGANRGLPYNTTQSTNPTPTRTGWAGASAWANQANQQNSLYGPNTPGGNIPSNPSTQTATQNGPAVGTTAQVNGQTYQYTANGWVPAGNSTTPGQTPGTTPATTPGQTPATTPTNPTYGWQQGQTFQAPDPNNPGKFITSPANPYQLADNPTAQALAKMFGGQVTQNSISGPGYGQSTPTNYITFGKQNNPNFPSNSINAGLAADALQKYGSGPGSYGQYLVQRDIPGNQAAGMTYDQWVSATGTRNPNLANNGPGYQYVNGQLQVTNPTLYQQAQTNPGGYAGTPQTPQQQAPQFQPQQQYQPFQFPQQQFQPQQQPVNQQPQQQNNLMSQLAQLYSMLYGRNGANSIGNPYGVGSSGTYLPPLPLYSQQGMYGFPYYSMYA